jgi:Ca2+-transporting ATPase
MVQAPAESLPAGDELVAHTRDVDAVADALGVDPAQGLSSEETAARRQRFGPNEATTAQGRSWIALLAGQFRSVLVLILIVAAGLAAIVSDVRDAIAIGVVLVLNAVLGFLQEHRAEASMEALRGMLPGRAQVRRDGRVVDIAARDVVPGDVVLLAAGDRVAADGRILVAEQLTLDEASLTGESQPVAKDPAARLSADTPLADRVNAAHMNTVVASGRGEVLVTATGAATSVGQVAEMLAGAAPRPTPLQRQLADLGRRLALVAAAAVGVVLAVALAQGDALAEAAIDAIALAVAAVPEGLPAVVTLTLAVGTSQMAKRHAIVKRLASVETLGCATVVCTDKTGTLTRGEMTVVRRWPESAEDALAEAMVLCNDAEVDGEHRVGDTTDLALVDAAATAGVDVNRRRGERPRRAELPFDSAAKLMATVHDHGDGQLQVIVKGAPDVLLARSDRVVSGDGDAALAGEARAAVDRELDDMANQALRTLAVATRVVPGDTSLDDVGALLTGLRLQGLIGLADPVRPEATRAIATCHQAGVTVKMVTGDHATTAAAVARELGIPGEVLTGAELDGLSQAQLLERVEDIGVFARVEPEHKVRLVTALGEHNHVVAMTGDGVNDAAALKGADIGVAMGVAGTEVTKEAGDVVLADDNFATIVAAVERGRAIYANIVSFVRFQLATNIAAISTILAGRLLGLATPFTPLQLLWVNLIMDGPPAMALGVDPPRTGAMQRPPRDPNARILDRARLLRLLFTGAVMAAGTLVVYAVTRQTESLQLAVTMAFTTFVLFQLFNALNARVSTTTILSRHTLTNGRLWVALAGVLALQIVAVHAGPAQQVFDTTALSLGQWGVAMATAVTVLVAEELRKLVLRRLAPAKEDADRAPQGEAG